MYCIPLRKNFWGISGILELALFGTASWALHATGFTRLALIFAVVVVLHYGLSWDRIAWLWGR